LLEQQPELIRRVCGPEFADILSAATTRIWLGAVFCLITGLLMLALSMLLFRVSLKEQEQGTKSASAWCGTVLLFVGGILSAWSMPNVISPKAAAIEKVYHLARSEAG